MWFPAVKRSLLRIIDCRAGTTGNAPGLQSRELAKRWNREARKETKAGEG
jgi:hypothetical protein